MSVRAPGKDLVPEQEDEVEEGAQAPQHQNPLLQLGLVDRLRSPAASAATAAAPDQIRPAACPYAVRCQPIVFFLESHPTITQTEMANYKSGVRWTDS